MNIDLSIKKKEYVELDLKSLILRCQADDMYALEELVKRYQKVVYSSLYYMVYNKSEVADLAQEVLYRVCKSIKKLKSPATFKSWVNQIMVNLVYDELRRKKRKANTVSIDEGYNDDHEIVKKTQEIADKTMLPDQNAMSAELNTKIREAIENLPEHFRMIIVYRELQGLSYEEIAKLTETNLGTVKSRIARARSKLQEDLKPYINVE